MQSYLNHLSERIQTITNGTPWFGKSVLEALEGIDEKMAVKTFHGQHNIAELIYHMTQWKRFTFEKAFGDEDFDIGLNSSDDWKAIPSLTLKEWSLMKRDYFEINEKLIDGLFSIKTEWLSQEVPGRQYDFNELINGIADHDIYHLGQVIYIYKMIQS